MIRLHCSKKLFTKLPSNKLGRLISKGDDQPAQMLEQHNELGGWYGSVLTFQQRNCVLLVHEKTRFPIFIPNFAKTDFESFEAIFQQAFLKTLEALEVSKEQFEIAQKLLQPFVLDEQSNRSMSGSLNHLKDAVERLLWDENASIEQLTAPVVSKWLSQMFCVTDGGQSAMWPCKAMNELLDQASQRLNRCEQSASLEQSGSEKVISFASFQKKPKS